MEQEKQCKNSAQGKKPKIERTKLPNIKKIIMVASGKGGVGKSTVAAGLALSLALEGYAVGLLDADIYGPSIPTLFNLENVERPVMKEHDGKHLIEPYIRFGIKIMSIGFFFDAHQAIIWRGPMVAKGLKQMMNETIWGELDFLIIDTPPGTGDVHITLLQEFEITGVIAVTTPQMLALSDVQKAISLFKDQHIGTPVLGIVENMSWFSPSNQPNEKYFIFGNGGGEKLAKSHGVPLLAQIPIDENVCNLCDEARISEMLNIESIKQAYLQLTTSITN